jgi:hypothetical protein
VTDPFSFSWSSPIRPDEGLGIDDFEDQGPEVLARFQILSECNHLISMIELIGIQ